MKAKSDIVANWLPRYTGTPTKDFSKYVLLVNFTQYLNLFAKWHGVEVRGIDRPMPNATANGITILNFGMGSASAATVMDLLGAVHPKAVLFLGKCGGLKRKNKLGDLILPIAAIRYRNGQRQRGHRDGPAGRGSPEGRAFSRKVRWLETQKQTRRPHSSHRGDPRR